MAALTDYCEAALIDWLLRSSSVTTVNRPSGLYLSLHTASPGESGSLAAEVSGNAYQRQAITFSSSGGTGNTANSGTVTFPTATGTWGTITYWGISDALVLGNMLLYGICQSAQTITVGMTYSVAAAALSIQFD